MHTAIHSLQELLSVKAVLLALKQCLRLDSICHVNCAVPKHVVDAVEAALEQEQGEHVTWRVSLLWFKSSHYIHRKHCVHVTAYPRIFFSCFRFCASIWFETCMCLQAKT
jgi:hypothetical protein